MKYSIFLDCCIFFGHEKNLNKKKQNQKESLELLLWQFLRFDKLQLLSTKSSELWGSITEDIDLWLSLAVIGSSNQVNWSRFEIYKYLRDWMQTHEYISQTGFHESFFILWHLPPELGSFLGVFFINILRWNQTDDAAQ